MARSLPLPESHVLEITGMLEDAISRLRRVAVRNSLILVAMGAISAVFTFELWNGGGYRQPNIFYDFLPVVIIVLTIPASNLISILRSTSRIRRVTEEIRVGRPEKALALLSAGLPFWRLVAPDPFDLVMEARMKMEGMMIPREKR